MQSHNENRRAYFLIIGRIDIQEAVKVYGVITVKCCARLKKTEVAGKHFGLS